MISLKTFLLAATKLVRQNFTEDVYIQDNNAGEFDKACFFIQVIPISTEASTKKTNIRRLKISIKYYQQFDDDICRLYDVSDKLERIFGRTIKFDTRAVNVESMENQIITDEIGRILDFMINIVFHDEEYRVYTGRLPEVYDLVTPDSLLAFEHIDYDIMRILKLGFSDGNKEKNEGDEN